MQVKTTGILGVLGLVGLLWLGGCAARPRADNPMEIDAREFDRVYDASRRVLREKGFVLDRQDHRFGRVTSKPLGSPIVLEVWRGTNSTFGQAMEATVNDERRIVTIMLDPLPSAATEQSDPSEPSGQPQVAEASEHSQAQSLASDGNEAAAWSSAPVYELRVEVLIERRQRPARRLTGSMAGRNVFGSLRQTPHELRARGIDGDYWMPIGRDELLERKLITAILRRSMTVQP